MTSTIIILSFTNFIICKLCCQRIFFRLLSFPIVGENLTIYSYVDCKRLLNDLLHLFMFMYKSSIVPKSTHSVQFYSLEGENHKPEQNSHLQSVYKIIDNASINSIKIIKDVNSNKDVYIYYSYSLLFYQKHGWFCI